MAIDNTNKVGIVAGGVEVFLADNTGSMKSLGILSDSEVKIKYNGGEIEGIGSSLTGEKGKVKYFKKGDHFEITIPLRELDKYTYALIYRGITATGTDPANPFAGTLKFGQKAGKPVGARRFVLYPHFSDGTTNYVSDNTNPLALEIYQAVATSEMELNWHGEEPMEQEVTFESQYDLDKNDGDYIGQIGPGIAVT